MAVLKCKMCGGDIQVLEEQSYGTCQYCGTQQTLPTLLDEQVANLYNRANHFRRLNEFDKAAAAYDNILNLNSKEAEACWGLVLSKYGIEYIEDPISHERIPTCHRVQRDSILADADYLTALENAKDSYAKNIYESEAKRIAEIQRGILSISLKEDPYDIFICYKETAENGQRTKDSTIAQDIYNRLIQEGCKVFFARITLEEKLGQQYEPYIFAALNSAKVMLVIGTKPEYFNAVWVKNEWNRFLKLMKRDSRKLLIPCYRDMNAYDLPDELAVLQSQDMDKIGFLQDLLRGIKKVLEDTKEPASSDESQSNSPASGPNVESLYKRACLFLEDGDFYQADEYFNRILDIQPEYAQAYAGKLCAYLRIGKETELASSEVPLELSSDYQKAIRFADDEYRSILAGYNRTILDRIAHQNKLSIYLEAKYKKDGLEQRLNQVGKLYNPHSEDFNSLHEGFLAIANIFETINDLPEAKNLQDECLSRSEECKDKAEKAFVREQELAEEEHKMALLKAQKRKDFWQVVAVAVAAIFILTRFVFLTQFTYMLADFNFKVGNYQNAHDQYASIADYKDSEILMKESLYQLANRYKDANRFEEAIAQYGKIKDFKDAETELIDCKYKAGILSFEQRDYNKAKQYLRAIPKDYKDVPYYLNEVIYAAAQNYFDEGNFASAASEFRTISEYKDADKKSYLAYDKAILNESYTGNSIKDVYNGLLKYKEDSDIKPILLSERYWNITLLGNWKNANGYYFKLYENKDKSRSITYNIPYTDGDYYDFKDNHVLISVGGTWQKQFKITLDENRKKITVYSYKDGKTYQLYR